MADAPADSVEEQTAKYVCEMVADPIGADSDALMHEMPHDQARLQDSAHQDLQDAAPTQEASPPPPQGVTTAMLPTGQPMAGLAVAPVLPVAGTAPPRSRSDAIAVASAIASVASTPNFLPDLSNQIVADHRNMQALFLQFNKFVANCQEQWMLKVGHAIGVLMRMHSQAEMQTLYPLVEKALPEGAQLAAKARQEHELLETELAVLDAMTPHVVTPDQRPHVTQCPFVKTLIKMGADFTLHIQDEELLMLDKLAKAVDGDTAVEAAATFDRVKGVTSLMPGGVSKEV